MKSEVVDQVLELAKIAHGDPGYFELTFDLHSAGDPFPFPAPEVTIQEGEGCSLVNF